MQANAQPTGKREPSSPVQRADQSVQTGALSGGQPGQAPTTSASAKGQSNTDAAFEQGTRYGTDDAGTTSTGTTVEDDRLRSSDGDSSHARLVQEAAYRRFEARGSVHGHDEEDWLAAEREVRPPAGN